MEAVLQQEGYDLIGAAMEVYNEKGHGFLEEVYQECLQIELDMRGIPFEAQSPLSLSYKGRQLEKRYRPDLMVFGEIVVELKAIKQLTENDVAQLLNYLRATGKRVGSVLICVMRLGDATPSWRLSERDGGVPSPSAGKSRHGPRMAALHPLVSIRGD